VSNLEKRWGFHFDRQVVLEDAAQSMPAGILKTPSLTDPDTGAMLEAEVRTDHDNKVRTFECSVAGSIEPATDLLPFCATLPYDGADSAAAKAWVATHLSKVKKGHPLKLKINGVQFELIGASQNGVGLRTLEISNPY
jgi:hypothetical protein